MLNEELFIDNELLNKNKLKEEWIKKYYYEEYLLINEFIKNNNLLQLKRFSQKIYHYINNITDLPKCDFCNSEHQRFEGFLSGYNKCCCKSCACKYSSEIGQINRKINTIKKHGVEHTSQLEEVKEKNKKTCFEKYGFEYSTQSEYVKEKQVKTMLEKYDVEYPLQCKESIDNFKKTCIEKYGFDNPIKTKEIQNKIKKNSIENYGVEWHVCNEQVKEKASKTRLDKRKIKILDQYPDLNIINMPSEGFVNILCEKCNNEYLISTHLLFLRYQRHKIEPCLYCNPRNNHASSYEKKLYEIIKEYDANVVCNSRKIIPPYEIDIYSEKYKIAIEINGLYWHSECEKDNKYHINKTKMCNELGIQLIHIWEDEWLYKNDIVISRISNLFKKTPNKIYARKCDIRIINDNKLLKLFLNENHLQGYIPSSINIGLFYKNELYSVMTFGKNRKLMGNVNKEKEYELLRFCNKKYYNVIGSASKLFNYFISNFNFDKITSYAKRDWTIIEHNIYSALNFIFEKYTNVNYYWCKETLRYHRYKFRKDVLVKSGEDKNLTEVEIMNNKGYYRIFDSGNLKYVYLK